MTILKQKFDTSKRFGGIMGASSCPVPSLRKYVFTLFLKLARNINFTEAFNSLILLIRKLSPKEVKSPA